MIECLKGFIGLSSWAGIEAESGLYVDALPDISTATIDRLTQGEGNVSNTWDEIEHRALLKFRTLFIAEVNKCHKVSKRDVCECLIVENKHLLATALWYLLGAEVMLLRGASSRVNVATFDKAKNKDIRQYFEEQFAKELSVAVASIDIHSSECFPPCDEPAPADIVTTHTPII